MHNSWLFPIVGRETYYNVVPRCHNTLTHHNPHYGFVF